MNSVCPTDVPSLKAPAARARRYGHASSRTPGLVTVRRCVTPQEHKTHYHMGLGGRRMSTQSAADRRA